MDAIDTTRKEWWSDRKFSFIQGLMITAVIACLIYLGVEFVLIAPRDPGFYMDTLDVAFLCIFYLALILIGNLFYKVGFLLDKKFNRVNADIYRLVVYYALYGFCIILLLLVPAGIVIDYFTAYAK